MRDRPQSIRQESETDAARIVHSTPGPRRRRPKNSIDMSIGSRLIRHNGRAQRPALGSRGGQVRKSPDPFAEHLGAMA